MSQPKKEIGNWHSWAHYIVCCSNQVKAFSSFLSFFPSRLSETTQVCVHLYLGTFLLSIDSKKVFSNQGKTRSVQMFSPAFIPRADIQGLQQWSPWGALCGAGWWTSGQTLFPSALNFSPPAVHTAPTNIGSVTHRLQMYPWMVPRGSVTHRLQIYPWMVPRGPTWGVAGESSRKK